MMKNKTTKYVVNGVLLAALAAIGITAFQLGTSTTKEETVPEISIEEALLPDEEQGEEEELVDAGTSQVEASLEDTLDTEETAEASDTASEEETEEDSADMEAEDTSAGAVAAPVLNFSEESLIKWPVNGNVLLDYNMDQTTYFPTLDQYKLSPAIAVQAVEGAPVIAAAAGTVVSIKDDVQTGTTVTMDLGNGYQAIYGQLTGLTVSEGDTVEEGMTFGYVSAPTKYYSKEGSNLYFAMTKSGVPVDPFVYLP